MLNPNLPAPSILKEQFSSARPFKHLSIDNFLIPSVAEGLLAEFPSFDSKKAIDELGNSSGKVTREDVRNLGPTFSSIDDYISSIPFLRHISLITGIPDLEYDPTYFGGGTHDNQHGQELDPHVDFNFNREISLHRRLNLIVYLNKEWNESWGGSIELHSDPRTPESNSIISFSPLFNRCVIFETNEYSWHGFSQIQLPPEYKHLSRKSFAIYLYSKERPRHEVAPPHRTFYIPRPLPQSVAAGKTLSQSDYFEIVKCVRRRDHFIRMYQQLELDTSAQYQGLRHHAAELSHAIRLDLLGYVAQPTPPIGYSPDRWAVGALKSSLSPVKPISRMELVLHIPSTLPSEREVTVKINDNSVKTVKIPPGPPVVCAIELDRPISEDFTLELTGKSFSPRDLGINADDRNLLCRLERVIFYHDVK